MHKRRPAFTLIEVMVAVLIISIVIVALLQMLSNNTHIFLSLKEKSKINQYASFFVANVDIGFEDDKNNLYKLVEDFPLDDDLRRRLKEEKIEVVYQEVDTIDMSEFQDVEEDEEVLETEVEEDEKKESNSNLVFEIGKTILKYDDSSVSLLRLRLE